MEENDANRANYDELASHVTNIESRLSTLSGTKDPVREDLHELRADYYERAIQVRQMRCQTLEAVLQETCDKLETATASARRLALQRRLVVACVLLVVGAVAAMEANPELPKAATDALQTTEAMTHCACLVVGGITVWWLSRRPRQAAADDPKKTQ